MKTISIVYMGSPDFAVPSLEKLHNEKGITVKAVVSGTDKKRGRGGALSPTPVKAKALQLGLPVIEADRMKDPNLEEKLREISPDLIVVVAFKILPPSLLAVPKFGAVNLHASLLPAYRGAAPIHHAVMKGEKKTGSTVFKLDNGVDTGGIILQNSIDIGPNETTGSVYERLMKAGPELLAEAVKKLADGTAELRPQDDSKATPAPKLFEEDCRVSFNRPAGEVHNHIRGLSPFPTAFAFLDGKKLKLLTSEVAVGEEPQHSQEPGNVVETDDGIVLVRCSLGYIKLGRLRYEGKKEMEAPEFFRGYKGTRKLD